MSPIDAVQVLKDINWHHKPTPVSEFESGFNQGLNQAMWIITQALTLTPPNETPPCYQQDGDGCAYQCYDGDDEPIDKCKECPLCYSDKQRHHAPPNEPLPVLVNDEPDREYIDYICPRCKDIISQRRRGQKMETVYQCKYHDNCGQCVDWNNSQPYRCPPEGAGNA